MLIENISSEPVMKQNGMNIFAETKGVYLKNDDRRDKIALIQARRIAAVISTVIIWFSVTRTTIY